MQVEAETMKLVMTLVTRNEADVVDAQLAYHLNAGVDLVLATDNGSEDGTTEILESYAREGYLHLFRRPGEFRQVDWVTTMARMAATEFGADWVLNTDSDEFWWPRGGSLKMLLGQVPERFGTVRALLRNFVPRPAGDAPFFERMIVRDTPDETRPVNPLRVQDKVAHRGNPGVQVTFGNHDVSWDGLVDLRGWHPIEVLHFPVRNPKQCERKLAAFFKFWESEGPERGLQPGFDALREGRVDDYYASLVVSDDVLAEQLAAGSLAVDTRLRDVLRTLRKPDGAAGRKFLLPVDGVSPLIFRSPSVVEQAEYAAEITVGSVRDSIVKVERRGSEVGRRLGELERGLWPRVRARVAHVGRFREVSRRA